MLLVDVHAHLDMKEFDEDRAEVINECENAGVKAILCNGLHPQSNRNILALAQKHPVIKPVLGFYPTEVIAVTDEAFKKELAFIKKQKPVAIGEIGLDKKWESYNPENKYTLQKERFEALVKIAQSINRPVILHTRKAELDVIETCERLGVKRADFHCFMGKKKLVQRIIDNGWFMSIPANAYKSQQFQMAIDMLPLNQILTETDSPYLSGSDERNTPANVKKTIEVIAKIKGLSVEDAANQVFMNYQQFIA